MTELQALILLFIVVVVSDLIVLRLLGLLRRPPQDDAHPDARLVSDIVSNYQPTEADTWLNRPARELVHFGGTGWGGVMNVEFFKSLPPDQRAVIEKFIIRTQPGGGAATCSKD